MESAVLLLCGRLGTGFEMYDLLPTPISQSFSIQKDSLSYVCHFCQTLQHTTTVHSSTACTSLEYLRHGRRRDALRPRLQWRAALT